MEYGLRGQANWSDGELVPVSLDFAEELEACSEIVKQLQATENSFGLFAKAVEAFERHLLEVPLWEFLNTGGGPVSSVRARLTQIHVETNYLVLSVLNTAKAFQEILEHERNASARFADIQRAFQSALDPFDAKKNDLPRAMNALRNFGQHAGLPISGGSFGSVTTMHGPSDFEFDRRRYAYTPKISLEYLSRESHRLRREPKEAIAELVKTHSSQLDVKGFMRAYCAVVAGVRDVFRVDTEEELKRAESAFDRAYQAYSKAFPNAGRDAHLFLCKVGGPGETYLGQDRIVELRRSRGAWAGLRSLDRGFVSSRPIQRSGVDFPRQ